MGSYEHDKKRKTQQRRYKLVAVDRSQDRCSDFEIFGEEAPPGTVELERFDELVEECIQILQLENQSEPNQLKNSILETVESYKLDRCDHARKPSEQRELFEEFASHLWGVKSCLTNFNDHDLQVLFHDWNMNVRELEKQLWTIDREVEILVRQANSAATKLKRHSGGRGRRFGIRGTALGKLAVKCAELVFHRDIKMPISRSSPQAELAIRIHEAVTGEEDNATLRDKCVKATKLVREIKKLKEPAEHLDINADENPEAKISDLEDKIDAL